MTVSVRTELISANRVDMLLAIAILISITAVCGTAKDAGLRVKSVGTQHEAGTKIPEVLTRTREKRVASIVAQALRKLIHGLKPIGDFEKYRNFLKEGDYNDALKDFKAFNPTNVQARMTKSGIKVITGNVGRTHIKIRSPGYKFGSEAVLDIIDEAQKERGVTPYAIGVVYKKANHS